MSELKEAIKQIKEIHEAVYGNGHPEKGLVFRMKWMEKVVYVALPIVLFTMLGLSKQELLAQLVKGFTG